MKLLVSACLMGVNCKYNGGNNESAGLRRLIAALEARGEPVELLPVCPEVLGGLPVPRVPAELVNGRVVNREGVSVDAQFRTGAEKALQMAREFQPDAVILQSRSPSCGVKEVYDGSFSGRKMPGSGLFAALAMRAGFRVVDIEDIMTMLP